MTGLFPDEHTESSAVLSDCGHYRYSLTRRVNSNRHTWCVFVMLNPSTADATADDPTIRACTEFARRWECGWLQVVNLFAWRATDPRELDAVTDPIGPLNLQHMEDAVRNGDIVVFAWGANGGAIGRSAGISLGRRFVAHHLGRNKDGSPRHPLYVKRSTPLTLWEVSP
ncbi:MAG TPA: DUF1643 domain-containing protein [Dokdonella sp.]|nr:DUF1643 domain-containing protein [Dokdonella sp.]